MIQKLNNIFIGAFNRNKIVLENFSFLLLLRLLEMGAPIIVYPYLINTVGASLYGKYVFAFSVIQYLVIIINFGFNSQITREVSIHRHSRRSLGKIISSVLTVKTIIFIPIILGLLIALNTIDSLIAQRNLYLFLSGFLINAYLFPIYYFRGIEKMRNISLVNMISKILSILLLFIFINNPEDYIQIGAIFSIGMVLPVIYAYFIIIKKENIRLYLVPIKQTTNYFKNSLPFFYASFSGVIKDRSTFIVIGKLFSMEAVAYFDLAYKVSSLSYNLISNLSAAFFPKVAKINTTMLKRKLFLLQGGIGITAYIALVILGSKVVEILGHGQMQESYNLLLIVALIIPFYSLSNALDLFYIIPSGKYKYVTYALIIALSSYAFAAVSGLLIWPNVNMIIIALVFSACIELLFRLYKIRSIL